MPTWSAGWGSSLSKEGFGGHSISREYHRKPMILSTVVVLPAPYVCGDVHTNSIKSFWAIIKQACKGTYHWISRKHLQRYVNGFVGKHNLRSLSTQEQMIVLVREMVNKRLRYADLIV